MTLRKMIPRKNVQRSVKHSILARQRRDVITRLTTLMQVAVRNCTSAAFAGRPARNQTFTSGGTAVMVGGRHLNLKIIEGLARVLVFPQPPL
jgi:hypothetical protein